MLFDNIDFINEGQQADEYRARKAKEEKDAKYKDYKRLKYRHQGADGPEFGSVGIKNKKIADFTRSSNFDWNKHSKKPNEPKVSDSDMKKYKKDEERYDKALSSAQSQDMNKYNGDTFKNYRDMANAEDAFIRHVRRHPEQYKESGIFESVEMI